mgnify:CR=1 FL=1
MTSVKFGLSSTFPCGYLDDEQEQLLVYMDEHPLSPALYSALQSQGFRRSEDQVYRPHCPKCQACQSIRIPLDKFIPSKSQKRILNKAKAFTLGFSDQVKDSYYPLFEHYVNEKHKGGVMYPAELSQLLSFTTCNWMDKIFVELYENETLIAVAISDVTPNSLSAVYTFYHPEYESFSLGSLMVMQQIHLAKQLGKEWLYLGYFIKNCNKMNYKTRFRPFQILTAGTWIEKDK